MKRILLTVVIFVITVAFMTTSFAEGKYIQYDLNKLAKKSQKRLKGLDKKIAKMEKEEKAIKKLDKLNNLYIRAEALYNQGKYNEAKALYLEIKRSAKDADIKAAACQKKQNLDKLRKENLKKEKAKRKAEKARQKKLAKQRKAKEKAAKKKELNRKKAARKTKRKGALIKLK